MGLSAIFMSVTLFYGLPPGLLSSLCFVETRHQSVIHYNDGKSDSYGICQIKYSTAKELGYTGSPEDLLIPSINISYAGAYLKKQINRYHSIEKAVIAYNKGHATETTTAYQIAVFKQWRQ